MNVSRLEALADAIAYYHRSHEPDSKAYKLRNPGLLIAYSLKYPKDEQGFRIFNSLLDGYQALLFDLKLKCQGKSKSGVQPENNLYELLMKGYGYSQLESQYIMKRLRKNLQTEQSFVFKTLTEFMEAN